MCYTTIKRYCDSVRYSYRKESLKNFVKAGIIVDKEYTEITVKRT
ncbi:XkdX family protein [Bacillus sp. CGMCC 1.16607]